jgi:hypothetical protein
MAPVFCRINGKIEFKFPPKKGMSKSLLQIWISIPVVAGNDQGFGVNIFEVYRESINE